MKDLPINPRTLLAATERGRRSIVIRTSDVEDATQDAMLRLLIRMAGSGVPMDLEAWMFRVGQNAARRLRGREQRSRRSEVEVEDIAGAAGIELGGQDPAMSAQRGVDLLQAYEQVLTARQVAIVRAAIEPGASMRQAACRVGIDASNFRRDLLRAALRIRRRMDPPQDLSG
jgi:RNA polymerase sigma factor (sigma-70 family)